MAEEYQRFKDNFEGKSYKEDDSKDSTPIKKVSAAEKRRRSKLMEDYQSRK